MAINKIPGEEMNPEAVEAFASRGYPIPGQSWTQPVEERRPFEGKPDFVDMQEALEYTALELLDEENYVPIVLALGDGVPVMDLALQMGYVGYREGKWNPDLMLMLAEPVDYVLIFMAENADITYRNDSDDDDAGVEDEDEKMMRHESLQNENMKKVVEKLDPSKSKVIQREIDENQS